MNRLARPWLVRLCQCATGLLFLAAALPKIGDPASFAAAVHNFRILPIALENLVAMTLPWIELVMGLVLVLNVRDSMPSPFRSPTALTHAGARLAAALLVVFTLAIVQAVARDLDFACGCFGTSDATRVGTLKLLENAGMLVIATIGAMRPTS